MVMIIAYGGVRQVLDGNPYTWLLIILFLLWGIRLTINWGFTFRNLKCQDWRYDLYKQKYPKLWPLINFLGIHLMPTGVVFIGMLPGFFFMEAFRGKVTINLTLVFAMLVCMIGIIIETVADIQMHRFRSNPANKRLVLDEGLWKNSRHPNYLGEIIFWFGIFLMTLAIKPDMWIFVFCPLVIFLILSFISVPLMEKRQLNTKAEYKDYKQRTNMYLIYPSKEEAKK